ncbi:MAG TPA: hypothetical protein VFL03_10295 [Candidatus Limnocylindrales bacterium]|nr:hypothetical protein [Candidatus Limnocylindrales bacterium]
MATDPIPPDIRAIADARADARRARDWATADRLKAELEAAGWKVIDAGSLYTLERAAPPDVEQDGRVRYGSSASVPSRLDDEAVGLATVVLVVGEDVHRVARQVGQLADEAPDGTQVVVVANGTQGEEATRALAALDARDPGAPGVRVEVVWTAGRLGAAAAWNAGIRRAEAAVVVLVREGMPVDGSTITAIAAALEDDSVAVAGPVGLVSSDLRTFRRAPADATVVDAIAGRTIGFRRADAAARGLLDEHFVVADHLDTWWSFVLRDPAGEGEEDDDADDADEPDDADEGDEADAEAAPTRSAVQVHVVGHTGDEPGAPGGDAEDPERARQAKRNFYRFLKRFATRRDLLTGAADPGR